MATKHDTTVSGENGFSLIETLIAMAILATGLLSMAGVFIMGLNQLAGSSASLIASASLPDFTMIVAAAQK